MTKRCVLAVLCTLLFLVFSAGPAAAHAQLESAEPVANATVSVATERVAVRLDRPVAASLSLLQVFDQNGRDMAQGPIRGLGDGRSLTLDLKELEPGGYVVKWRAVAFDGHTTNGAYPFYVGQGSAGVGALVETAKQGGEFPSWADYGLRLTTAVTIVAVAILLARRKPLPSLLRIAVVMAIAAAIGELVVHAVTAGNGSIGDLLQTQFAALDLIRFLLALMLLIGSFSLEQGFRRKPVCVPWVGHAYWRALLSGQRLLFLGPIVGLLAIATIVGGSHSESVVQVWPLGFVLAFGQVLSFVYVIGLLSFSIDTGANGKNTSLALVGLATAVTAAHELDNGGTGMLSIGLMIGAAVCVWLRAPFAVRTGLAVGLALVFATSTNAAPESVPESHPVSSSLRIGVHTVDVVIDPARAGDNGVHAYVSDANGLPAHVTDLELTMHAEVDETEETVGVDLQPAGTGHFVSYGVSLQHSGPWRIDVGVIGDDGSTSITSAVLQIQKAR